MEKIFVKLTINDGVNAVKETYHNINGTHTSGYVTFDSSAKTFNISETAPTQNACDCGKECNGNAKIKELEDKIKELEEAYKRILSTPNKQAAPLQIPVQDEQPLESAETVVELSDEPMPSEDVAPKKTNKRK